MHKFLVLATLLSVSIAPPTAPPPSCSLYDDSPVGVVCFQGDNLTAAIATGRTGWLVEFYSSWCGHCQHFAPTWKELAKDMAGWAPVIQLGVVDCSTKDSYSACSGYGIRGYPTIRFFQPGEKDSSDDYDGSRKVDDIEEAVINRLQSWEGPLSGKWPHFDPLQGDHLLTIPAEEWVPVALVFEEETSLLGRKLMLDLLDLGQLKVYRTLPTNLVLVNHYAILEFPSLVIEPRKDDHLVVPGHFMADPRREFAEAVHRHFRNIPHTLSLSSTSPNLPPSQPHHTPSDHRQDSSRPTVLQDTVHTSDLIQPRLHRSNRVSVVDVLGAVSYVFRREVTLHTTVAGSAFTALLRFTFLLEDVFMEAYPAALPSLSLMRARLETRLSAGFITSRDWKRLIDTKLNETLFPPTPTWDNCRGSQSHYRGYPCALWTLSHTLTVLTLPIHTSSQEPRPSFRSREALKIVSEFIRNFFSCDHCREHFSQMAQSLDQGRVLYDGDAVLWLWEAHNRVNQRLAKDISSDPLYPKYLFPSPKHCPYCYTYSPRPSEPPRGGGGATTPTKPTWSNTGFRSNSDSLLPPSDPPFDRKNQIYLWNRTAVLLYLWGFYHYTPTKTNQLTHRDVLEGAWPKMFAGPRLPLAPQRGLGLTSYDLGICVTYYIMCGGLMVGVAYWLLRRRLRQYRHFLHP